ncbi:tryptophanase [candidate division WOR-3 bacterium]|nr:tryptophanase [candidate division WOR-3 bacterium]
MPDRRSRMRTLRKAGFNPFQIPADQVIIDLISDSGTGAMSVLQWQALISASEDFSGQTAYRDFVATARRLFSMPYIQPVHQGRVAENLLFRLLLKPADCVVSNTHFETTRSNIESIGGRAIDLPEQRRPYCGNLNVKRLTALLRSTPVRMIVLSITNNIRGGQPVSVENMRRIKRICQRHHMPLIYDASRFSDNAYLIQEITRTKSTIPEICARMFQFADMLYLSCKKSVMVNVGGCIALRSKVLFEKLKVAVLQQESYPTSGGLAARDLAAMNIGLREAVDGSYLHAHWELLRGLGRALEKNNVPIIKPIGGHAITIPLKQDVPHAAFALAATVYHMSGVRGGVFNGQYRLALPRRVYSLAHLQYVAQAVGKAYNKPMIRLKAVNEPAEFHDFLVRFKKI